MEIPKIWDIYPDLAHDVSEMHFQTGLTGSGHDADHDFEVAQLALIVAWKIDPRAAVLAGVGGLLHSTDRILEQMHGLAKETASNADLNEVEEYVIDKLARFTDIKDQFSINRIVQAVVHHGSKPNDPDDDLVTIAVADGDKLGNLSASLPFRSGQFYPDLRILNPDSYEIDTTDRSAMDKYNYPDSLFADLYNCMSWSNDPNHPYGLRTEEGKRIGRERVARLQQIFDWVKADREFVGLDPYPSVLRPSDHSRSRHMGNPPATGFAIPQ